MAGLALAALGVVYGDIGTSPLYAVKECFHGPHAMAPVAGNVLGVLSLMFWSVTLVVSFKYLAFILRADNQGEGGVLAMLALLPDQKNGHRPLGALGVIGSLIVLGSCLLYGEGVITPAISVLSAVEGLGVATHTLDPVIVPTTVAILVALFLVQRRGTTTIGRVFGPIMVVWFATLGLLGLRQIASAPEVLAALSPLEAVRFAREHGFAAFRILGSVVLCITGAEALYADMGHFGRKPIRLAWYFFAMPALVLNYLGQGALLIARPDDAARIAENPFYRLVSPGLATYALVGIATAATVIASQALISGAFSLTRQAVQLGLLPRMTIRHTSSETEGQIYIPEVNWALAVGCIALVFLFKESSALAAAYGIAVTGTMAISATAFFFVARTRWGWPMSRALPLLVLFLAIDLTFFASNVLKFFDGGFVPVVIAIGLFVVMRIWKRGRALLGDFFRRASRPLDAYLEGLSRGVYEVEPGHTIDVVRVSGVAVFLTSNAAGTPPILLHHTQHNKAVHRTVVLITVVNERVPRVREGRVELEPVSQGFYRLRVHVGYMESPNVPRALALAKRLYDLPIELDEVTYYLGRETLLASHHGHMGSRAEAIFAFLTRNSQQATKFFKIPPERVVEIGMQVDL
jgi:KUP system potassium uptake protein